MDSATDYLRTTHEEMNGGYTQDCVFHACALAQRLAAEGKRPWIGRVRDQRGDYHEPLLPLRFLGGPAPVWNVHYVCCVDGDAYDPIVGGAVAIGDYAQAVFGKSLPVIEHVSRDETAELLRRGELRHAFSPRTQPSPPPAGERAG